MFKYYPLRKIRTTQAFGLNRAVYAQFGMAGHNGVDFRTRFDKGDGTGETYKNEEAIVNGKKYKEDCEKGEIFLYAVDNGRVITSGFNPGGYGEYVKLSTQDGEVVCGHLKVRLVSVNDVVVAGQIIGITDNTGFSSGPHLHFGIKPPKPDQKNGFLGSINPVPFFKDSNLPAVAEVPVTPDAGKEVEELKKKNKKLEDQINILTERLKKIKDLAG